MGAEYLKDAFKIVYNDPDWSKEAQDYEMLLGTKLYHNDKVKQEAKRALVQLSKVLNKAYGSGGLTQSALLSQLKTEETDALVAISTEIAPEPIPDESGVPKEEHVEVTDTMMQSFLRKDAGSAGQIMVDDNPTKDAETGEMQHAINMANMDFVINGDVGKSSPDLDQGGNLREMMTMLYNGVVMSGGMEAEGKEGSFKRILKTATPDQLRQYGINTSGRETIQKLQKGSGDIYDPMKLMDTQGKFGFFEKVFHRIGSAFRKKKSAVAPLGLKHYEDQGIAPSGRERALSEKDHELQWKEGAALFEYRDTPLNIWRNKVMGKGHQIVAGLSGTTQRLMTAYKALGANKEQLLNFRLALLGYMLTSKDHSLYEIIEGARSVGVAGKEDMTDAASLYMSIDPLTTDELRNNIAKEKKFPQEHIYKKLMDAYKARTGNLLTYHEVTGKEDKFTPGEAAVNIYTTNAYNLMNKGMNFGRKFSDKMQSHLKEEAYLGADQYSVKDKETVREVGDLLQLSSKLTLDYISEATRRPQDSLKAHGFEGDTFRGEGVVFPGKYKKKGNTIKVSQFTSTSTDSGKAKEFYQRVNKMKTQVLLEFHLHGKSGVNVSDISAIRDESEVLVAPGSEFIVKEPLHKEGDFNIVELEEIKGPGEYLTGEMEKEPNTGSELSGAAVTASETVVDAGAFMETLPVSEAIPITDEIPIKAAALTFESDTKMDDEESSGQDADAKGYLSAKLMLSWMNKGKMSAKSVGWLKKNGFMEMWGIHGDKQKEAIAVLEKYTTKEEAGEAYTDANWKIINDIIERCVEAEGE